MAKCKYYRESPRDRYIPDCNVDSDGEMIGDVHPDDAHDWTYCPDCGRKIKFKEWTAHPRLNEE